MGKLSDLNIAEIADAGAEMTIMHPTLRTPLLDDEKQPLTIRLVGTESDIYIKAINRNRDQNVDEARRRAKWSADADDYKGARLLARCTLGWHGIPQGWVDGSGSKDETPAEFTYDNALKLYQNRGVRWLREQVDEFIADRSNFIQS